MGFYQCMCSEHAIEVDCDINEDGQEALVMLSFWQVGPGKGIGSRIRNAVRVLRGKGIYTGEVMLSEADRSRMVGELLIK